MNLFSFMTLLGGLAFFLFGMNIMSQGLEKMSGGKLEKALKKMTSNPFKSLLLGMGITIAIQSSSAMTVMLVGFVNSGIMELEQTIGVIMGSNIGTTLTAWILSLAGIESDNFWLQLLKPETFSPMFAFIGILMMMVAKKEKNKDIGRILIGFSVLMYGMTLMSDAVSPLADVPEFQSVLTAFRNPLLGVLIGAGFTGIIQSSAASIGILQALSLTGSISYGMAIPIIMGQNIGTCVTALLSSIGVNKRAKQVAVIHIYFNVIGTIFFMVLYYGICCFHPFTILSDSISPVGIAAVHSIFNIVTTFLLLPFSRQLRILAEKTIPVTDEPVKMSVLDERFLNTPSVAIAECKTETIRMTELVDQSMKDALGLFHTYSEETMAHIIENEEMLDEYEDQLGTYLVKLSGKALSDKDSREISKVLHVIGDFERMGDHELNIAQSAKAMSLKNIHFSEQAVKELSVLLEAVDEIIKITIQSYCNNDVDLAAYVEPLEQVVDNLTLELKDRHIQRIQNGECTIELGFIFSDLLTNLERVSDHCSNIAVSVIQISDAVFDTHQYLNNMKNNPHGIFMERYQQFHKKFHL